jgi:hypothetical protein
MSTLENLISETNKQLLWEVLIDELKIASVSQDTLSNIRIVFDKNLAIFRNKSNPNEQLIHLNKQFLKIMVIAVNKLFPNLKHERRIKKINISDEPILLDNNINTNILYKAEDIQQSRQNQFTNLYNQKKEDFEQYTQINKPTELDFSDHIQESKITSMDNLLAEALAQRNADLQTIDNTFFNSQQSVNNDTNISWLQSEETSNKIKSNITKNINLNKNDNSNESSNKRLKYLNVDDPNNISLTVIENNYNNYNNSNNKKKVSWDNNNNNTIDIFSKLKKVDNIEEKQFTYETQTSIPLPKNNYDINNINIDNISSNSNKIDTNIQPTITTNINTPVLTNSQIVKQLNEMNSKLDKLFSLVEKLLEIKENNSIL